MIQHVELPCSIFPKGRNLQRTLEYLMRLVDRLVFIQSKDLPTAKVSIHICAGETRKDSTAIDIATGNRTASFVMKIFRNRQAERGCLAIGGWMKAMCSFHHTPAVIATAGDQVDFFPFVLSDISDPKVPGLGV